MEIATWVVAILSLLISLANVAFTVAMHRRGRP